MAHRELRDIPRVWEVDWAIPAVEGGTPWESYDWLLETAADLGSADVTLLGATYEVLGRLDWAIDPSRAQSLRVGPHSYREAGGFTVHGVSRRGSWHIRGPVLVAWANDQVLAEIESRHPPAIAAVASWPDDIRRSGPFGGEVIGVGR